MTAFLSTVPEIVLYGCGLLIAWAVVMTVWLVLSTEKIRREIQVFSKSLDEFRISDRRERRDGLSQVSHDRLQARFEVVSGSAEEWWREIDSHIGRYTSPSEVSGWFLTEKARHLLPFENAAGKRLHSAIFTATPGLLTGAGLTLTFVAILWALQGVHYDKANTSDPISGIDSLINGLSGKFLSSIVALLLSIFFTLLEKFRLRAVRRAHERMAASIEGAIPYLSQSRVPALVNDFETLFSGV